MTIRDESVPRKAAPIFAQNWARYHSAGWPPLPIGSRSKNVLVAGYTGWRGEDASELTLRRWARQYKSANLALRMPRGVVGLDVDAYHDGDATLAALQADLGPLPVTCRTTSRAPEDAVSGIYLFRVPGDTVLNGTAGVGIEIVQRHHRYAIAPPSIHPDTGRAYGWWWPRTNDSRDFTPAADRLPALPGGWVEYLSSPRGSGPSEGEVATLSAARDWYVRRAYGEPCAFMAEKAEAALAQLAEAAAYGGLHDTLNIVSLRLCRWAAEGHPGLHDALTALRPVFVGAARTRGRDLAAEWRRAVGGAACAVAGDDYGDSDPCAELEGFNVRP